MKKPTIYIDRKLTRFECLVYALRTWTRPKRVREIETRVHEASKELTRMVVNALLFKRIPPEMFGRGEDKRNG